MYQLYIGNKNYSSWSMRPWVLLTQTGIAFDEVMVPFQGGMHSGSAFKQTLAAVTPAGKVPVLAHGELRIWDSLAIAEYLAEQHPLLHLWPQDRAARAHARSICAEMHGGFASLRSACPMNIEADLPEVGALAWRDKPGLRADVERLQRMWEDLLALHGGPMLFGDFSIADAYFAPVCMRLHTYHLPVSANVRAYVERVRALPGVAAWTAGALAEQSFVDYEEPFRLAR